MTSSAPGHESREGFLLLILVLLFALTAATAFGVEVSHLIAGVVKVLDGIGSR